MITLKMDSKFLGEIDGIVKSENYQNRTEFIRAALRKEVDEEKKKETMVALAKLRGSVKTKTSPEEYERIREETFEELMRMTDKQRQALMNKFFK
jgi:Arc/MetJ-type ribon-helix-helix transcriptional regulator